MTKEHPASDEVPHASGGGGVRKVTRHLLGREKARREALWDWITSRDTAFFPRGGCRRVHRCGTRRCHAGPMMTWSRAPEPGLVPSRVLGKKTALTFQRCVISDAQRQQTISTLETGLRQGNYRPGTRLPARTCFESGIFAFGPPCVVTSASGFVGPACWPPLGLSGLAYGPLFLRSTIDTPWSGKRNGISVEIYC